MMDSFPSYLAKVRPSERRAGKIEVAAGRNLLPGIQYSTWANADVQEGCDALVDKRSADAEPQGSGVHSAIDSEQLRGFVFSSGQVESIVRCRPAERAGDVEGAQVQGSAFDDADREAEHSLDLQATTRFVESPGVDVP